MITGFGEVIKNIFGINVDDMIHISIRAREEVEQLFQQLEGKTTNFIIEMKDYNWEKKDSSSFTFIKMDENQELKRLGDNLLKEHKLAPSTPIKNQRKMVIDIEDLPDEIPKKRQRFIKEEEED
ncbi:hypothetical protein AQUCO_02700243v1 [Aquilegia coerulea]|uniref:Uncharacterized protein n=1 Tax=Aquilegia coerulea TaxID=218851 RepID=A0A2G5D5W2_AQUCA|nr:hypothetical protein AQUCO_02700243v1 [Aquilegia coerulea]